MKPPASLARYIMTNRDLVNGRITDFNRSVFKGSIDDV